MNIIRRPQAWPVAIGLVASGLMTVSAPQASIAQGEGSSKRISLVQALKKSALIFPIDSESSVKSALEMSALMQDLVASRMSISGQYVVTFYSKSLPQVARLHNDQKLSDADIEKPFSEDRRKPSKVARLAGFEIAFVGKIEAYEYKEGDKQATVTVSGQLIEIGTDKVLKSVVTSGASRKGGDKVSEAERALEATRTAGEDLVKKLVVFTESPVPQGNTVKEPVQTAPKRKSGGAGWLWGALAIGLGLGLGIGLGGRGGGGGGTGGGGGGDRPPAPPR